MNKAMHWARAQGLQPVMMTLTARHGLDDDLATLLDAMKRAKKRLHQHRRYKTIKADIVGSITATEVTNGANGWHPHFHVILFVSGADEETAAVNLIETLREAWLGCLAGVGLDGNGSAFHTQNAAHAGAYIAKWGAAEEMTLTGAKKAKGKGMTPLQLLADVAENEDPLAARLWQEYAEVFQGRRQLVWSRGLKARVGVSEISDEQAAGEAKEEKRDPVELARIAHDTWAGDGFWKGARHRRGRILDVAETDRAKLQETILDGADDEPDPDIEIIRDDCLSAPDRAEGSRKIGPQAAGEDRIFLDAEHDQDTLDAGCHGLGHGGLPRGEQPPEGPPAGPPEGRVPIVRNLDLWAAIGP